MMMRARFLLPLLLLAAPALAQFGPLVESAPQRAGMVAAHGTQQMVAAANPLAAAAGKQILDQGGSAMDAVIAMQLVLTLVEPQSSGIGGGGFVLHFDAKHSRLTSLDGRETAPAAARDTLFLGADGKPVSLIEAYQGGRAVGVPGMVALMVQAHKTQGKLPWKALFVPAIKLARDGFAVSPRLSGMLVNAQSLIDKFPAKRILPALMARPLQLALPIRTKPMPRHSKTSPERGQLHFIAAQMRRPLWTLCTAARFRQRLSA
jgi:gamma-glutamyltranspeptidase / glutathione hydrolase